MIGSTIASWPAYRFLRRQVRWSGIPNSFRIFHSLLWSTVRGFSTVNEAKVDDFLEFPCFFYDPKKLAIWSPVPLPVLNPPPLSGDSWFIYCWGLAWRILSITLLACKMSAFVPLCWTLKLLSFFLVLLARLPLVVLNQIVITLFISTLG